MKKTAKKLALHKETLNLLNQPEEMLEGIHGGSAEITPTRQRTICLGTCNCGVS